MLNVKLLTKHTRLSTQENRGVLPPQQQMYQLAGLTTGRKEPQKGTAAFAHHHISNLHSLKQKNMVFCSDNV